MTCSADFEAQKQKVALDWPWSSPSVWLAGTPFPKTFMQVAKKILSRLFRVFVHVYIHHFDRVSQMGAEAHVNTCYKHFYYFVTEFNLTDHKELEPLVSESGKVKIETDRVHFQLSNEIKYLISMVFYALEKGVALGRVGLIIWKVQRKWL